MPTAEIITIGTELLLGEAQDTNTREIAQALGSIGVDLYRTTTVGDNPARIAEAIRECLERADIVITTGGLGPTVDDPTREAAAAALDRDLVFREELWEEIVEKFSNFGTEPTENNRRQAYLPDDAEVLDNPWGTAPAFAARSGESVLIALPGVPEEMRGLLEEEVLPYLQDSFDLREVILTRSVETSGVGESRVDHLLDAYERMANPTVGLAAHRDGVEVRITAKAASRREAHEMIDEVEEEIRELLSEWLVN
jgi:competence/damage-inducible protein CinA-like protein